MAHHFKSDEAFSELMRTPAGALRQLAGPAHIGVGASVETGRNSRGLRHLQETPVGVPVALPIDRAPE